MTGLSAQVQRLLEQYDEVHLAFQEDRLQREMPNWQLAVHHQAYLLERIRDVQMILGRLGAGGGALVDLAHEADRRWPDRGKYKSFPADYQEHLQAEAELTNHMKLDMESLLVFGNLLLDQLAMFFKFRHQVPGSLSNWKYPFQELCRQVDNDKNTHHSMLALRNAAAADVWWLRLNVRSYRNTFIEHPERAWQRGSSRMVYGDDFTFFIPASVGSLTPEQIADEYRRLDGVSVPDGVRELVPPDRRRLEWLVHNIETVAKQSERDTVEAVWKVLGGESADYRVIGRRLAEFAHQLSLLEPQT